MEDDITFKKMSSNKSPSKRFAKKNGHGKWRGTPQETYNIPAKSLDDSRNAKEDKLVDAIKFNRQMLKLNDDDLKAARLTLGRSRTGDSFESRIAAAREVERIADLNLNRIDMLEKMLLKAAAAFAADDEDDEERVT